MILNSDGVSDLDELITDEYEITADPIGFSELLEMYNLTIDTREQLL